MPKRTSRMETQDLGPLAPLLARDDIEDIYVLGPSRAFVSLADGRQFKVDLGFGSHEALLELADRMLEREGKELTPARPFADCRLADGSRAHIATAPSADPWPQIAPARGRTRGWRST